MCGGDDTGDQLAKAEKRRQRAITQGQSNVNAAFLPFNDAYYQGRERDYRQYYLPQLDLQAKDARGSLTQDLGRSGLIDSSVGAKRFANLQGTYDAGRKRIIEGAKSFSQQIQAAIEGQRSRLLRDVEAGGGIGPAGQQAALSAQIGAAAPQLSPLGNLFSNVTGGLANAAIARQYGGGTSNGLYNAILDAIQGQQGGSSIITVK